MFYWGIFVREFQKCCCHLWIQHFQFSLFGQFNNTTTMPKFRTEDSWFGYFGAGIWKQKCHTWNQHLRICLIANFSAKNKNSMFGTTNALFWFFDQKYVIWVFYLERIVKKLLPFLKSAPSNLPVCKTSRKHKNASIWELKGLIWAVLEWDLQTILSYSKSTPSNLFNCKIWWENKNA